MPTIARRALLRTGLGAAGTLAGVPIIDGENHVPLEYQVSDTDRGVSHSVPVIIRQTAPDRRQLTGERLSHRVGRLLAVQQSDLERSGLVDGQQVRLRRGRDGLARYTVVAVPDRAPAGTVWLDEAGLERLAATDRRSGSGAVEASLETPVPDGSLAAKEADEAGEFVEAVLGDGAGVAVIAPHGGRIEAGTARQAARTVEALPAARAWLCRGFSPGGGAFERWHVTSTALHPASYPGLATLATREYDRAVSFHGVAQSGVLVGGGAALSLRRRFRDALAEALPTEVSIRLAPDGPSDGDDPENPVNWLTTDGESGLQLEQGWDVRAQHGETVAETVGTVFQGS
ncbi:MAG: poly-gamma-glutamate hydrolase family protein [Haloarculaceae archaeon]